MSFSKTIQLQINFHTNPLQVRIEKKTGFGKKALLSAPAALTLEAALVLTLFLFAAVSLLLPIKILNTERKIQAGLEAAGEELSSYAYISELLKHGETEMIPGAGETTRQFSGFLAAGAAEQYAMAQALEHADTANIRNTTMERSKILEDGAVLDLILDYQIRLPFPVLGLPAVERSARCRRRAWIGKAAGTGETDGNIGGNQNEMVYIGKNSTRYHKKRSCHYLSNDLSLVSYDTAATLRNSSGGKYYPCSVCGKGAGSGDMVYIMPSGSSFHLAENCTAIIAYVQVVPLADVVSLGPCSYCSGE